MRSLAINQSELVALSLNDQNLSEIRSPYHSDFGVVWILVIRYSDIYSILMF